MTDQQRPVFAILNKDFGSLGEASYFLSGVCPPHRTFVPRRLWPFSDRLADQSLYDSLAEVHAAVREERPRFILFATVYLLNLENPQEKEYLAQLLELAKHLGIPFATTDPFYGYWLRNPWRGREMPEHVERTISRLSMEFEFAKEIVHVYPHKSLEGDGHGYFPRDSFTDPGELRQIRARIAEELGDTRPLWLFVLGETDLDQLERDAAFFFSNLCARLRDCLAAHRRAHVVCPERLARELEIVFRGIEGFSCDAFCAYSRYTRLLIGAELVLSWHHFAFSLTQRYRDGLPVIFLGKGHMRLPGMHSMIQSHFFADCQIWTASLSQPFDIDELLRVARQQAKNLTGPYVSALEALPSPEDLVRFIGSAATR